MKLQAPEQFFEGTALQIARAVRNGDAAFVTSQALYVDLNKVHQHDMTLLFYAVLAEQYSCVTELIKAGADPKQTDPELGSPLDYAVRLQKSDALTAMLNGGVSPDATNSWGTPLLFTAACQDSMSNLQLLVARKANLDADDGNLGRTAVYEAFSKRCYDQAEYLIRQGARVDITLITGVTLAYSLEWDLKRQQSGSPGHNKLLTIKRLLETRGVKFPADPPPVVRARLKAQGKKVAE